jgi:hypothetical protein
MVSKYSELTKRDRPETTMRGSLLPRAASPLQPHAVATPLLLLHPMTRLWRCGRCLLLLRHAWVTPPQPPWATITNALTSGRSSHMNTASRFQLFSIITKCIRSFSDSKVRKQIDFRRERASADEEGRCCTGSLYQC